MKKIIKEENNPTLMFISKETKAKAEEQAKPKQSKEITFEVEKKETKSRLLHIALKPSYYKVLEETAQKNNLSVNETLNQLIKQVFKLKD